MRILIAVGASGGHIYPALAVAELLAPHNQVYYTGGIRGLERKILQSQDVQLFLTRILPWVGVGLLNKLKALILLGWATIRSLNFIRSKSVDVLLSSGSYSSTAAILAAIINRLPFIMMEMDCQPSFTTRKFGRFARWITLANQETVKQLPLYWQIKYTGTPIRKSLITSKNELTKTQAREKLNLPQDNQVILVIAGSQGSEKIEQTIYQMISNYPLPENRIIIASAGKFTSGHYLRLSEKYSRQFVTKNYIDNISLYYAASDLVISRSGAMTVAELKLWKKPSILIPIQQARGHQLKNAQNLINAGLADLIKESDLTADKLFQAVEKMLKISTDDIKTNNSDQTGAQEVAKLVLAAGAET